jgi:hypothetical protein
MVNEMKAVVSNIKLYIRKLGHEKYPQQKGYFPRPEKGCRG